MSYATGDQIQLAASDATNGFRFGGSVALSGDGLTLAVGSASRSSGGTRRGAVYVFKLISGTWTQQVILTASDGADNDFFGWCVDISSNGSVVVVGAPFHDSGGKINNGRTYAYNGSNWSTQTILDPPVLVDDAGQFGYGVAISGDGTVIVAGAPGHPSSGVYGTAWVFSGSGWSTKTTLAAASPLNSGGLGFACSISYNGSVIYLGAPEIGLIPSAQLGRGYLYLGSNWGTETSVNPTHRLIPGRFGASVDMTDDGSILVSGDRDYIGSGGPGIGYAFSGVNYTEQAIFDHHAPTFPMQDFFSRSVAIGGDGKIAAMGASNVVSGNSRGAVYLFRLSGSSYGACTTLIPPTSTPDMMFSLANSSRGISIDALSSAILVGAPMQNDDGPGYAFIQLIAFTPCVAPAAGTVSLDKGLVSI